MKCLKLMSMFLVLFAGAILLSCDLFGNDDDDAFEDWVSQEKSMTVNIGDGGLGYGQTYIVPDPVSSGESKTLEFRLVNWGQVPIRFWGVADITDRGHLWWHKDSITIGHIDSAFQLNPGQEFPFTVSMDAGACRNVIGAAATACGDGSYQIEIGISNKDAIAPNPFMFRVLFTVPE